MLPVDLGGEVGVCESPVDPGRRMLPDGRRLASRPSRYSPYPSDEHRPARWPELRYVTAHDEQEEAVVGGARGALAA